MLIHPFASYCLYVIKFNGRVLLTLNRKASSKQAEPGYVVPNISGQVNTVAEDNAKYQDLDGTHVNEHDEEYQELDGIQVSGVHSL